MNSLVASTPGMQSTNESLLKEESGVEAPCDFAIVVEGETISVRRNVLEANSWYFRAMLASGMTEVQNGYCIIRNASVETVKACLECITTNGEVLRLSKGTVADIIGLSILWQLDDAVQKCQEFLKETLNLPSWISTMRTAALYELKDLEEWCVTYIIRYLEDCGRWEGVLQMSECEVASVLAKASSAEDPCKLWLLCKKWWEHNGSTPGTTACRIIRRFPSTLFSNSGFQKVACQDEHVIFCENCGPYVLNTATVYLNTANCWILRTCSVDTGRHSVTKRISEFMIRNHKRVFAEKELMEVEVDEFLSYVESLSVGSNIPASARMYSRPESLSVGSNIPVSARMYSRRQSLSVVSNIRASSRMHRASGRMPSLKTSLERFVTETLSAGSNIGASGRMYPRRNLMWPRLECGRSCMTAADCKYLIVLATNSSYDNVEDACSSMGKNDKPDNFDAFSMRQLMYNLAILNGDHTIWKTTMRWIQADYVNRRKEFLQTFVDFPLYKLSTRFIEENMSNSTLLRESPECMDTLKSEVKSRKH